MTIKTINNIIIYMDFEKHLEKYLPKEEINLLIESLSKEEKKSIYLNTSKISEEEILKLFPNLKHHPVVQNGFLYEKNEYELGKNIYHDLGAYYIQEPSAMLVANFLDAKSTDIVLDLCAAPGGKTIQTALKMNNKGMIIANDLSKERANILLSNLERLGISNTVVTSLNFEKHTQKFNNFFDKIILDAPCSGSGMFRKSEQMRNDWTYEKVLKNSAIQKDLILMCYKMLKAGGTMVYSTCSYSYEEDEEIINYLLENSDANLVMIPHFNGEYRSPNFVETVHLFPSHFSGEGHYIALIKKPGELTINKFENIEIKRTSSIYNGNKETSVFVCTHKLPKYFEDLCLRPGLIKETIIGNKSIPTHHYAKSENNLPKIELSKEETIKYLHGETINKNYPNGYAVVTYLNMPIGLVHVVNNILKNLYPKGLRYNSSIKPNF